MTMTSNPNDKDRGGTQRQQLGFPSGLTEDRAASSAIPSSDVKSTASNAASTRGIDGKVLPSRSTSFRTVGTSTRPTSPTNGIQGLKADDASFASSQSSALLPLPGQPVLLKELKKLRRQMNAIITDHGD